MKTMKELRVINLVNYWTERVREGALSMIELKEEFDKENPSNRLSYRKYRRVSTEIWNSICIYWDRISMTTCANNCEMKNIVISVLYNEANGKDSITKYSIARKLYKFFNE